MREGSSSLNRMAMLNGGRTQEEAEIIEELLGAATDAQPQKMEGLHQFNTQEVARVVHIKASSSGRQQAGAGSSGAAGSAQAVLAAGVGWGLGRPAAASGDAAAKMPVSEMEKKKQIWKLKKTFGLEAVPLQDGSAQVAEYGAGAWQ